MLNSFADLCQQGQPATPRTTTPTSHQRIRLVHPSLAVTTNKTGFLLGNPKIPPIFRIPPRRLFGRRWLARTELDHANCRQNYCCLTDGEALGLSRQSAYSTGGVVNVLYFRFFPSALSFSLTPSSPSVKPLLQLRRRKKRTERKEGKRDEIHEVTLLRREGRKEERDIHTRERKRKKKRAKRKR